MLESGLNAKWYQLNDTAILVTVRLGNLIPAGRAVGWKPERSESLGIVVHFLLQRNSFSGHVDILSLLMGGPL